MVFLGRNGVGKIILIKCIFDFVKKESGEVLIFEKFFNCDEV